MNATLRTALFAIAPLVPALLAPPLAAEPRPRWELGLGAGVLAFPPWPGSTQHEVFVAPAPYVVYRGERLQADRGGIRARLFDTDALSLELSLAATPPPGNDDAAREGMPELDPVAEFGPELRWRLWRAADGAAQWQLRLPLRSAWSVDTGGIEGIGLVAAPAFAYAWQDRGWKLALQAGPLFGSDRYHGHFHTVAPRHATADRRAYDADAGYGGLQFTGSLTRRSGRWWAGVYLRAHSLDGARFADGPLARSDHALSAGFAFARMFAQSRRQVETRIDDF
ncbi:MAG: hypothetical protein CALGDGBN_01789 [Pseudomonadales bacterium]|nr:hypothetical protein [Pseudomonadales bacterium]